MPHELRKQLKKKANMPFKKGTVIYLSVPVMYHSYAHEPGP